MLTAGSRGSEGRGQGEALGPPRAEGLGAWPRGAHRQPGCSVRPPPAPPRDAAAPPGQAQVHSGSGGLHWGHLAEASLLGEGQQPGLCPQPLPPPRPSQPGEHPLCVQTHGPASSTGQEEERKRWGSRPPVHLRRSWATPVLGPGLCCRDSTGDPRIRQGPEGTTNPRVRHSLQKHLICWSLPAPRKTGGTAPIHPPPHARAPGPAGVGQAAAPAHCSQQPGERARRGQDQGHGSGGGRVPIVVVLGLAEGQRQGQAGLPLQPLFFLAGPRRPGLEEV